jgi:hypothetical protein
VISRQSMLKVAEVRVPRVAVVEEATAAASDFSS